MMQMCKENARFRQGFWEECKNAVFLVIWVSKQIRVSLYCIDFICEILVNNVFY